MISHTCPPISDAHARLIKELIWSHQEIETEDGEKTWEGGPMGVTITSPLKDMINPASSFQEARCEEYAKQLCFGTDAKFDYTYHDRFFAWGDDIEQRHPYVNQIQGIVDNLKECPESRRAVAVTWNPKTDIHGSVFRHSLPCLMFLQYLIRDSCLHCNCFFRSEDILSALGPNAYAVVRLQECISGVLNIPVGTYTHIVTVPHLYPTRDKSDLERWL